MSTERKGPLSRFKVIDLTRARAGPTAARHFADWGADVIKVEMPAGADLDPLGGSRDGPDFFNLHRNKRSITLNLKLPEGAAVLKKLAATADVLIENYRPDVKHRLGIDYETLRAHQSAPRLRQPVGFRPGRPLRQPAGLRPDRAGHGRPHVDHRPAGPRAGAGRHSDRRSFQRQLRGHGRLHRAARAGGVGRGAVGTDLAAAGADLHARFPGRALERGAPGAGPGRQRSSDLDPDWRVSDRRRTHQHCRFWPAHLQAHVRSSRCAEAAVGPRFCHGRKTLREPRTPQCGDRVLHQGDTGATSWSSTSMRPACRRGRSTRSTRCLPIRRSSTSAWPCRCRTPRATMRPSSTRLWFCHAQHRTSTGPRQSSASIQTRCWRTWVTTPLRSATCAAAR